MIFESAFLYFICKRTSYPSFKTSFFVRLIFFFIEDGPQLHVV